ncbi:MAG: hypothetical protein JWM10_4203, partial [Myxococcaceae bacterium]|nr:hypothetical protein [Myxococcaceae bacterium]
MSALSFVQRLPPVSLVAGRLDARRSGRVDDLLSSRRGLARDALDACAALLAEGDDDGAAQ